MRLLAVAALLCLAGCGAEQQSKQSKLPKHPERQGPPPSQTVKAVKKPASNPKGVMLIFSGGAWLASPPDEVAQTSHYRERYAKLGWLAVDVGYRPRGQQGFVDVTRAYDKAKRDHPGLPICAVGESSGGHLALMLAIARPLDCVEPVDAPTDLTKGLPKMLTLTANAVFDKRLARWSPALRANEIKAKKVLIVEAAGDQIVPPAQAKKLKA